MTSSEDEESRLSDLDEAESTHTPKWISERCRSPQFFLYDTHLLNSAQLKELTTFLESTETDMDIDTLVLSQTTSKAAMKAIFKGLRVENSVIRTLHIDVNKQHLVDPDLTEWVVGLNQARAIINLQLELFTDGLIQPWIRALQLISVSTRLQFQNCEFSSSDVQELVDLISTSTSITELTFNSRRMDTDDFARFYASLKSDNFIRALTVDYVYHPVPDCDATALADVLKKNETLTSVKLVGREISSSGRTSIAAALNSNSVLTVLNLPSKVQDDDCQKLITSRLQQNRSRVHTLLTSLSADARQTERIQEFSRRKRVKQLKFDAFIKARPLSPTKIVPRLTHEKKEEGQSVKKEIKFKLSLPAPSSRPSMVRPPPLSVPLNEHDVEYLRLSLDFHHSFAGMPDYHGLKFEVTRIELVTNPALKQQFDQSYQYFKANNYHSKQPIRSVYHSTKPGNIPSIIQSNLSMSKAGEATDSGWFGKGLYFSPNADYVMMYHSTGKLRRVRAGDLGKILQFDILPGRMLQMKDVKIGGGRTPGYDSHVSPSEFEYVMFDSRHILPRYIISFRVSKGVGSKFEGSIENLGSDHPASNFTKAKKK